MHLAATTGPTPLRADGTSVVRVAGIAARRRGLFVEGALDEVLTVALLLAIADTALLLPHPTGVAWARKVLALVSNLGEYTQLLVVERRTAAVGHLVANVDQLPLGAVVLGVVAITRAPVGARPGTTDHAEWELAVIKLAHRVVDIVA